MFRHLVGDLVFGTAHFASDFTAPGVRDQIAPPAGEARDYGRGFRAQQWLGLKRRVEFSKRRYS